MNEEEVDRWFRFIGYGNPASWLWFVGIEEGGNQAQGGPQSKDHDDFMMGTDRVTYDPDTPLGENLVWTTAKDLAAQVGHIDHPEPYFLSNIAPLPRNHLYVQHVGLDFREYRDRVIHERVGRLKKLHSSTPSNAMLFHGAAAWRTYQVLNCFGLSAEDCSGETRGLLIFEKERLIFTSTFSWGERWFKREQRKRVVETLKKWAP